MNCTRAKTTYALWLGLASMAFSPSARALDLDWAGQFRAEANWVRNYSNAAQGTAVTNNGYAAAAGSDSSAHFQTLFFRLMPKVTVNDNVYLNSEFWLGSPTTGLFGDSVPYSIDRSQYDSTFSRGAGFTAQRLWADIVTDFGTVQVGRAPLNWGLGLVWNEGAGVFDRYQSTGDTVRVIAKFGAFSFVPAYTKYTTGSSISGACLDPTTGCLSSDDNGSVTDYSVAFRFENPDDEFEAGLNFIRRLAGGGQKDFTVLGSNSGYAYNTFDLYVKKAFGKFSLGAEVPLVSGNLGGAAYKTTAMALETAYKPSDRWEVNLRAGRAPGQASGGSAAPVDYKGFYFHPNYKLGLIMFNYQLANFRGPVTQNNIGTGANGALSPYDNPVSNAQYLSLGGAYKTGKWNLHSTWTFATATQTASAADGYYWNVWHRQMEANGGGGTQSKALGWEMDYGATLQWDERFQLGLDFGVMFPGKYYEFSASATPYSLTNIVAGVLSAGVSF